MLKITFNNDPKTKEVLLDLFGNFVDSENFIIDKNNQRIIDSDGQEMNISQLGAIKNGSQIFVKKNIVSLMSFYRKHLIREW